MRNGSKAQCRLGWRRQEHDDRAHRHVEAGSPVDLAARDQELLVDRPQKQKIEVAGSVHELR